MRNATSKIFIAVLGLIFSLGALFGVSSAVLAKPHVKEIEEASSTTVLLPIRYKRYEDKKVVIRVVAISLKSGQTIIRDFNTRLADGRGKKEIIMDGLSPSTTYSFKVQIRNLSSGSGFSSFSEERIASTTP